MLRKYFIFLWLCVAFLSPEYVLAKEVIYYSRLSGDGYWQIWSMAPDGSQARQLTDSKLDKREPFGLLDGRVAYRTNEGRVYILARDGSEVEILSQFQRVNNPQLSHDGQMILFTRFDPRFKDIRDVWKSDLNGERAVILTRDIKWALQPGFSWDNRMVVFVKADPLRENHHIWIMDADGSKPRQLTKGKGQDLFPRFSPDGKTVTFSSNRDNGNFDIYQVRVNNRAVKKLTHFDGLDSHSCFSPDGKKIAFVSNQSGRQQIWAMDSNGSDQIILTNDQGESLDPHWVDLHEEK